MRYLSVCSGIEAATVAWEPLGFQPIAFAEIDKFPSAVLAHHYPTVRNLGDMRNAYDSSLPQPDILVGGTPCQSFSIAGNGKGMDDSRGVLALEFCELARYHKPRWVLWENVPNALSIQKGEAFNSITSYLSQLGYDLAWRVLDAQYVRVDGYPRALPQRRRRVFLVGCLRGGTRAAAVLFDRESVSGNPAPSRYSQSKPPATVADYLNSRGIAFGGNNTTGPIDVATARNAHGGPHGRLDFESETFVVAFNARQDPDFMVEFTHPLDTDPYTIGICREKIVRRLTITEAERLQGFPDGYTNIPMKRKSGKIVYPKDGPRYKAVGNSMAVNCMRWIGQRIQTVHSLP